MSLASLLDSVEGLPAFAQLVGELPPPGWRVTIAGLPGSADAVIVAALARRLPTRFFVVATDLVVDAERWLADLGTILDDLPAAFYPPREGFGEAEPHMEVAGERVETIERLTRGELRILITTARALLERTRMPQALAALRIELRKGDTHKLDALTAHLEAIGFERVPMVDDVAQFSLRGGILDVYSFGMTDPVRVEFWGDEIAELRHFDLTTQRSTREVDLALVLPVDGHVTDVEGTLERRSITGLFPPDTLLIVPSGSHIEPEMRRTWDDAQHHIDLARRRGEDAPDRDELFEPLDATLHTLAGFGTLRTIERIEPGQRADIEFPFRQPEAVDRDIRELRRLVRDGTPTIILC
ncbi:MAG TPA: hypothetical protein VMH39_00555, partial [Gemmatimonadaceae bacterium]|nr:hypothetical protein [Gemmatimonadaceae bacterium]